ncbi:MAG: PIG-L family deacetylase [Chloroflexi bacterium]|nr:PIG-L family deacetylase [Chloroflexota bacterium]
MSDALGRPAEAPVPPRIMVVTAHPDDADFSCSGSVAKWCAAGAEVVYVLATSGDKGSPDPDAVPAEVAATREQEQRNAGKVMGLKDIVFLRQPDGGVEDTPELRGKVVRAIRMYRPVRVVTMDPFRRPHNHRDHRTIAQVTMDAVFPYARDHLHYPEHITEGFKPHIVEEVLLIGSADSDYVEDITDFWEAKLNVGRQHVSQIRDMEGFVQRRREEADRNRVDGRLFERFKRIAYTSY